MDEIDRTLTMSINNLKYDSSIIAALKIGKATLDKYYNKTNMSKVYQITMGK
jgi:glycerol kinase